MTPLFADTFYFLALINSKDHAHRRATELTSSRRAPMITTAWVLTEVADGLCSPDHRGQFLKLLNFLRSQPAVQIIAPNQHLFEAGIDLYAQRPDKAWSLTDCVSFIVMQENGLFEALTGDHHFEQAGFVALLK